MKLPACREQHIVSCLRLCCVLRILRAVYQISTLSLRRLYAKHGDGARADIQGCLSQGPAAASARFTADPPTTTLQRLKALLTVRGMHRLLATTCCHNCRSVQFNCYSS